jgi:hypothetical protein
VNSPKIKKEFFPQDLTDSIIAWSKTSLTFENNTAALEDF